MRLLRQDGAAWLAASAAILRSAVPASAETYLTEQQALAAILGDGAIVRRENHALDATLRAKLEHDTNLKFPESSATIFVAGQPGQPQKYAIVMNEIGKTEPITFMVGITDQGKVSDVVIMVFRENRGWEVKEKRFLNQFRGKTLRSPIRVEEDIINYTGATLSSKAVARGVKRALALINAFYINKDHEAKSAFQRDVTFAKSESPSPIVSVDTGTGRTSLYRQARYAMGTVCEVRLWCGSASEALSSFHTAFAEIERLEQIFSAYREDSELAVVNREAARLPVPISDELFDLSSCAVQAWQETNGLCDISIGPLQDAWNVRSEQPRVPSASELTAALALVGCDKLQLDPSSKSIRFLHAGMRLDFGGIAKGYAAQRVAQILQDHGAHAALTNLGRSSISTSAPNLIDTERRVEQETGVPFGHWLVAISPLAATEPTPAYTLLRPNENLSTSGTNERQFQIAESGKTFSHVLNPRTGFPIAGRYSVTAFANSGPESEALAKLLLIKTGTAGFVPTSPSNSSVEWLALSQSADGQVHLSENLQRDYWERT